MPLDFPTSPAVNQSYTFGGRTWIWDGSAWNSYNLGITTYVSTVNGLTGNVNVDRLINGASVVSLGSTGSVLLPNGGKITDVYLDGGINIVGLVGATGNYAGIVSGDLNQFVVATPDFVQIGTDFFGAGHSWNFDKSGVLTLPSGGHLQGDVISGSITTSEILTNRIGPYTPPGPSTAQIIGDYSSSYFGNKIVIDNVNFDAINIVSPNGLITLDGNTIVTKGLTAENIYASNIVNSWNGLTGEVTGVATFNGATGAISGVNSVNGLTGALSLLASTGIGIAAGGKGITFTNTGVLSFNGLTGAVTGVTQINAGSGILISGTTNPTITNTGVTGFNGLTGNVSGITAINAGTGISITGTTNPTITNTGVQSLNGSTGALTDVASLNGLTGTLLLLASTGISVAAGGKGITFTNTGVLSFNGLTGAVTGVTAVNSGTGISISGTTNPTITNTGVQSFNGLTGTVTGVTTSVANTFTALQTFNTGITSAGATFNGNVNLGAGKVLTVDNINSNPATNLVVNNVASSITNIGNLAGTYLTVDDTSSLVSAGVPITSISGVNTGTLNSGNVSFYNGTRTQTWSPTLSANSTITFPSATTTLSGNSIANTFTALQSFNSGISASGATFSGNISAPNIVTSVNGLTGPLTLLASTGISIAAGGKGITFTNTGVQSFNGLTGAVTGVTTSTANTFTALQTFNSGISASGATFSGNVAMTSTSSHTGLASFAGGISASGATFSGTIILNGQTFTNVVSSVNGYTGIIGAFPGNPGLTTGYAVYTYPDGVTTYNANKNVYYHTLIYPVMARGPRVARANRTYFVPFNMQKTTTIKSIRASANNNATASNVFLSIYSADPTTGFPSTKLFSSASTAFATSYNTTTITNVNTTVPAGFFYLAATFDSTPQVSAYPNAYILPIWGAPAWNDGYQTRYCVADTSGFTAPSAVPTTGVTFAFVDYDTNNYMSVAIEYGIVNS